MKTSSVDYSVIFRPRDQCCTDSNDEIFLKHNFATTEHHIEPACDSDALENGCVDEDEYDPFVIRLANPITEEEDEDEELDVTVSSPQSSVLHWDETWSSEDGCEWTIDDYSAYHRRPIEYSTYTSKDTASYPPLNSVDAIVSGGFHPISFQPSDHHLKTDEERTVLSFFSTIAMFLTRSSMQPTEIPAEITDLPLSTRNGVPYDFSPFLKAAILASGILAVTSFVTV